MEIIFRIYLYMLRSMHRMEEKMRKYKENGQLETVWCNVCGKRLVVKEGILREGAAMIDHAWDYFSEKDGEVHHFDVCEACYDEFIAQFQMPVEVEEQIELI